MDNRSFETIQEYYARGGMDAEWQNDQERIDPNIGGKYFELLKSEGIIPQEKDKLENYVLYSPSANQRLIEFAFAKKLDELCEGLQLEKNPRVICADAFGTETDVQTRVGNKDVTVQAFKPGFSENPPELKNVEINTISAKANEIPLADDSVDTIWDRLGAMWHYIEYAQTNKKSINAEVKILLDEYARVLKKGGQVLIDAGEVRVAAISTYALSRKWDEKVDFQSLGWEVQVVSEGTTQLAILRRIGD